MATFSRGFLSNLGQPAMSQSLFNLGSALGSVPGAMKAKRKREEELQTNKGIATALLQAQKSLDPDAMFRVSEQLISQGRFDDAQKVASKALELQEGQKLSTGDRAIVARLLSTTMVNGKPKTFDPSNPKDIEGLYNQAKALGVSVERAKELQEKFAPIKERKLTTVAPGSVLVNEEDGSVVYRADFKEDSPSYKITEPSDKDSNFRVFTNGVLTETIPIGDSDSEGLDKRMSGIAKLVGILGTVDTLLGTQYAVNNKGEFVLNEQGSRTVIGYDPSGFSGLGGAFVSKVPGTKTFVRERLIRSLRANLGLESIAELKALSSTGSTGLGAVSNIELEALQSALAALDVGMDADSQRESLLKIRDHMIRLKKTAAGVVPADTIDWNSEAYVAQGFSKSASGIVYYNTPGDEKVYRLSGNKFIELN